MTVTEAIVRMRTAADEAERALAAGHEKIAQGHIGTCLDELVDKFVPTITGEPANTDIETNDASDPD